MNTMMINFNGARGTLKINVVTSAAKASAMTPQNTEPDVFSRLTTWLSFKKQNSDTPLIRGKTIPGVRKTKRPSIKK